MALVKINSANCIHCKDLWDLEVFKASYSTHSFSRHWHEGFGIGVIECGCEMFDYHGEKHYAPSNSVILMNPGVVHTGQAANPEVGWKYRMMYPTSYVLHDIFAQITGKVTETPYFTNPVVVDSRSANQLLRLFFLMEETSSLLECQSYFFITMTDILRKYAKNVKEIKKCPKDSKAVDLIRQYIDQRYNENISLLELSEVSGRSQFHLLRVFQKKIGLPPHSYQIFVRIQKAKEFLLAGQLISSVALNLGFADQSHFTRHFKRVVGVTPHNYR